MTETLRQAARAHGLDIGAAVAPAPLQRDAQYASTLARQFGMLTAENAMKAGPVHPEPERYDFAGGDLLVDFARRYDMAVRGHTLIWHNQLPVWVQADVWEHRHWQDFMESHIGAVATHYRGGVAFWDVVNEALDDDGNMRQTPWSRGLGSGYLEQAFRLTHAADPQARLFYNDYGAEALNPKSDGLYRLLRDFLDRGVPVHGVGLQMHIPVDGYPPLEQVAANMERLGALGLEVHVTELDVRLPVPVTEAKLAKQAQVYGEIMDTCLAAASCTALVLWGFTDGRSWVPGFFQGWDQALIFDAEYRPKPAYHTLMQRLATWRAPDSTSNTAAKAHSHGKRYTDRSGRILLAEDDSVNQKVVVGLLAKLNMQADCVTDGTEVLQSLASTAYDLIFMDIEMAGMDGIETTRRIRQLELQGAVQHPPGRCPARSSDHRSGVDSNNTPPTPQPGTAAGRPADRSSRLPIVAMTAHSWQEYRDPCLQAGMDDCITKPVSYEALRRVLECWLPPTGTAGAEAPHEQPSACVRAGEAEPAGTGGRPASAGESGPEETTAWNRERLQQHMAGDEDLIEAMVEAALTSIPPALHNLEEALSRADATDAQRQAHSIKGAAANLFAPALQTAAARMEQAAERGDVDAARTGLSELTRQFDRWRKAVRRRS